MRNNVIIRCMACSVILTVSSACTLTGTDPTQNLPPTFTVAYDGNGNTGGTVPADSGRVHYEQGTTVVVLDDTGDLERIPAAGTSEAFNGIDGWNTQADGNGTSYAPGEAFIMGTADVTLYAQWKAFMLRDTGPAGGLIFYDKGIYSAGWRYLEAAPADQGEWLPWSNIVNVACGGTSTSIGTGKANSALIIAQPGHIQSSAKLCLDYYSGTYGDWFLPSKEELNLMYSNLCLFDVGDFRYNLYWSSSESSATHAWPGDFALGTQNVYNKVDVADVRAARAF